MNARFGMEGLGIAAGAAGAAGTGGAARKEMRWVGRGREWRARSTEGAKKSSAAACARGLTTLSAVSLFFLVKHAPAGAAGLAGLGAPGLGTMGLAAQRGEGGRSELGVSGGHESKERAWRR